MDPRNPSKLLRPSPQGDTSNPHHIRPTRLLAAWNLPSLYIGQASTCRDLFFLTRRRYGFIPVGIAPLGIDEVFPVMAGAKGYRQRQGVDYEETFSPVAMLKSIRIFLAIAAHYDYEVW